MMVYLLNPIGAPAMGLRTFLDLWGFLEARGPSRPDGFLRYCSDRYRAFVPTSTSQLPFRLPKCHLTTTIRPLTEVHWRGAGTRLIWAVCRLWLPVKDIDKRQNHCRATSNYVLNMLSMSSNSLLTLKIH